MDWMTLQDAFIEGGIRDRFTVAEGMRLRREEGAELVPLHPFKHQMEALNLALASDNLRFGIFDEPGVGKTVPAQIYGLYYALLGNKAVIVMPPVLLRQFADSCRVTFEDFDKHFSLHILKEGPAKRKELYQTWQKARSWPDFMCVSYQMYLKEWQTLKAAGYEVIIADEAHALKNAGSNVHKAVAAHLDKPGERALLEMTGTPMPNTLEDAYGMIKMVSPEIYPSKKSFERQHCEYVMIGGFKKLIGFRNEELITRNLYKRARRVTKDQVLELPPLTVQEVPVELSSPHMSLYKKLVNERFLEVGDKIINAVESQSLRMKCLQMVGCPHNFTDKPIKNAVVDTVWELLDSIGVGREKVVLFAYFQETIKHLGEVLKELNPALVYGGSNTDKNVERFKNDPSCRALIAQPLSGGVGLNLQKQARYVIFVEPTSVPGHFKQAMERVYRQGQKGSVTVYVLKVLGTSSPGLTAAMLGKESLAKKVSMDARSVLDSLLGEVA